MSRVKSLKLRFEYWSKIVTLIHMSEKNDEVGLIRYSFSAHIVLKQDYERIGSPFLAKLFPQLCSCHWNGNYDLFSNFVTFLALLWPFCDLFMTFSAILWPFCDLYDLFVTLLPLLWPFYEWQKRSQFYERQNDTI